MIEEGHGDRAGIGAVLLQEGKPITFMSQKFSERAQAKSVYERELMTIVLAIQRWRPPLGITIHTLYGLKQP